MLMNKMKTWTQWQEMGLHTCTHVIAIAPQDTHIHEKDTRTPKPPEKEAPQ